MTVLFTCVATDVKRKHEKFVGLSFDTISSTGANAAVIHYKPERGNCPDIDPDAIYLCDSGGQYYDGTTDTTRTLHFGKPTEMERKAYTLVLKGNIALEKVKFPKGTTGFALDTLARQFLWNEGLDYRHGTGHGVGSYLVSNRISISSVLAFSAQLILVRIRMSMKDLSESVQGHSTPRYRSAKETFFQMVGCIYCCRLNPHLTFCLEPGYYEDGKFGIRIESKLFTSAFIGIP